MLAPKSESLDKTFQIFFSKMLPLNKENSWFVELGLFGVLISASAMLLLTYGRDHLESKINYDFRKKNLKSL